jgi:hypothetical protein
MREPCQYVYRYNENQKDDEYVADLRGEMEMPVRGQIIVRNGKQWKVVMVTTERVLSPRPPVPVHTVALTDNLKLPL